MTASPPTPLRELAPLLGVALACALTVWAVGALAPHVALEPRVAFALGFAAVVVEILLLSACAPTLSPRITLLVTGLCVATLFALRAAPAHGYAPGLLTLALGLGSALAGAALGARIEQPGQLTAVALVSSIADLWSVLDPSAPSARFAAEALAEPERLALFALPFPLLGTAVVPAIIGAGDVVFAALYVAAFRRHGLGLPRALVALGVAFMVGLAGLLVTLRPLPLLPLLGGAVVLSDVRARSLAGREWRTVLLVCAALISVIALRVVR